MYNVKKLSEDMYWIGGNDRRLSLFESVFPIPRGVSYNSYLILDNKTVLLDSVDRSVSGVFFENIEHLLGERMLDYIIVNHMEPDHCASLGELVFRYPEVKIVCNSKTEAMIKQFFSFDISDKVIIVSEGQTISTGRHTFAFVMAPMVHWPEVMVTYDTEDKILYSADAFGTFGALGGNFFADEVDFESDWLPDARRYYTNIVGKYGTQVQALLKKALTLDISMVCPLHGPIWRKNIRWFIDKYIKWSTYTPEENGVMIAYASVYGDTENAAEILAEKLSEKISGKIALYDVSVTHPSVIVAEAFRYSHLVFASTTYNAGIFCNMETALLDIKAHNLQNRTVALIENGSWAATSGSLMKDILSSMKNMTILDEMVSIKSSVKERQIEELELLAEQIAQSMPKHEIILHEKKIEPSAMFSLSYGLYVVTANDGKKCNGCIINTAMQVTDSPKKISIVINKANYTHDIIISTGIFNLSVLTIDTPFKVFEHFGFQSGRDADKFDGYEHVEKSENGVLYLTEYSNAFISAKVIETRDCGTHTIFIAEVTEAAVLSNAASVTYQYYFDNIKPKPIPVEDTKKGFICKVCGYFYEGETLPDDFICPLCKHGAEDFEPVG